MFFVLSIVLILSQVKKSQHRYVIGPRGAAIQEILRSTGVSIEMPPLDTDNETITLRGDADKLGNALTLVYEKVRPYKGII